VRFAAEAEAPVAAAARADEDSRSILHAVKHGGPRFPDHRHLKEAKGHLLLTGSVAGRRALPGSLYSSTKWAVTGMGESVRQELNGTGARVTVIEPGMVDTPFFDSGAASGALEADDVARVVMFAVSQPPHVDVNEILVRPTTQDN
jgi:NADP-dependent 3-hydroxy acid dehydrogenase YdfG